MYICTHKSELIILKGDKRAQINKFEHIKKIYIYNHKILQESESTNTLLFCFLTALATDNKPPCL